MPRSRRASNVIRLVVLAAACCLAAGCATHADRVRDARTSYYMGDLASAQQQFIELEGSKRRNRDCLQLDRALVALAQGQPTEAEANLREVRDRWRADDEETVGEQALQLVTDEAATTYRGEDYERVLLRAMLALTNLMHDGGDAAAYCEQFHQEQNRLLTASADVPDREATASRVALGVYLKGALMESTHRDYDAAQRAFATVAAWQPQFAPAHEDLRRAASGVHSAPGNGVIYVWAFVNPGPQKVEVTADATSTALLIADQIVSTVGDYTVPPTVAPVKIPMAYAPPPALENLAVFVDGQPAGRTQTITDVGRLAVAQSEANRDRRIAEAVARRVVKKGAIYATKDALSVSDGLTSFAMDAVGVLWEAVERADTRCWSLLPGQIQVLRIEVPAGAHRLSLQALRGNRSLSQANSATIEVVDGGNSYVLANYPHGRLVGELVVRD